MRFSPRSKMSIALSLTALLVLVGAFAIYGVASGTAAHAANAAVKGQLKAPSVYVKEGETATNKPTAYRFSCQVPTAAIRCYGPRQIRNAYDIQPLLDKGFTGKGRTIVIIDAYQSPTIVNDLTVFDKTFGLPNPEFNIIAPQGLTPFNPNDPIQVSWSGEISLDVEWSHAVAPGATIDLVLAKTSSDADLLAATQYAVDHNLGDVISQSFGEGESCSTLLSAEHRVFQQATAEHMSLFASSGDQGAAQASQPPYCGSTTAPYFKSASTPASDPLVTGVGATYLNVDTGTGAYIGEAAWNDAYGASGGGFSTVYRRPAYQDGVFRTNQRGVPDVAYNGDVNGGVLTVWSSSGAGANLVYIFGGTSAGSPQWAAITAITDQVAGYRLGFLNGGIYRIGKSSSYSRAFHDIRIGNNTFTTTVNGTTYTIQGYDTEKGWDAVTGWGSPNVANLVPLLIANVHYSDANGL